VGRSAGPVTPQSSLARGLWPLLRMLYVGNLRMAPAYPPARTDLCRYGFHLHHCRDYRSALPLSGDERWWCHALLLLRPLYLLTKGMIGLLRFLLNRKTSLSVWRKAFASCPSILKSPWMIFDFLFCGVILMCTT